LLHLREPSPTLQILGEPYGIEESDLELLKQAGVTGAFEVSGSSGENHRLKWPKAKALIVSTGPLQDGTALPQPKACSVVYVQEGKTFRSFPADVPTNSRRVLIRHEPPEQWFLEFERSDGGVTGTSFRN
jgi:hypothetical protein